MIEIQLKNTKILNVSKNNNKDSIENIKIYYRLKN